MEQNEILALLQQVQSGALSPGEAAQRLQTPGGFAELGYAKVDTDRARRQGMAEVIYGAGKTDAQITGICAAMLERGIRHIMVTRIGPGSAAALQRAFSDVEYHEAARLAIVSPNPPPGEGRVLVLSAGTSDMGVAEEAALTAQAMGANVRRVYDAGVSGLHRLLAHLEDIREANAIVVVAGMDGALPSVTGGLTDRPVIAVPTSVGYGAAFQGVAPLLSMLNSCASGVAVMNIDNGFGAGLLAGRINRLVVRGGKGEFA